MKQHQLIALAAARKASATRTLTDSYQTLAKVDPFVGLTRAYKPLTEEGEKFPPENRNVPTTVKALVNEVIAPLVDFYDLVAAQENTNTKARADVVIDGSVFLKSVPVGVLLFMEKQCVDLTTMISKMPTLDPSEQWNHDSATGVWATPPVETAKTKKIPRNHVKAVATDKHPAQVEVYTEDIVQGYWSTIKRSGAVSADQKAEMLTAVRRLSEAVKTAREGANGTEVEELPIGEQILHYIFAPLLE